MKSLSERAGGWVMWREDVGEVFVPLAEWAKIHEEHVERLKAYLAEHGNADADAP